MSGTSMHLCVKSELLGTNGIVAININVKRKKQIWLLKLRIHFTVTQEIVYISMLLRYIFE